MDEQQFQLRSDEALKDLYKALSAAADNYDFDADYQSGKVTVEFEDPPTKFVISPQFPVRQMWVSALVKSFKLDWSPDRNAFVLADSNQTLRELIASAISQQLGESVTL